VKDESGRMASVPRTHKPRAFLSYNSKDLTASIKKSAASIGRPDNEEAVRDPVFNYDVFLSHSAKDKAMALAPAERLRQDGLRVWSDEWECPSPAGAREGGQSPDAGRGTQANSIPAKIEKGPEHSRVLVLCMSAQAFGSEWAQLVCPAIASERRRKAGTFRRRDPLNKEHRFMPALQPSAFSHWLSAFSGCPHQRHSDAITLHQLATGDTRGEEHGWVYWLNHNWRVFLHGEASAIH